MNFTHHTPPTNQASGFAAVVKTYTDEQLTSVHQTLGDSLRRCNSKIGWLRQMGPLWTANHYTIEREMRNRQMIAE